MCWLLVFLLLPPLQHYFSPLQGIPRILGREELGAIAKGQLPVFLCLISFKPPQTLVASLLSERCSLELWDFKVLFLG